MVELRQSAFCIGIIRAHLMVPLMRAHPRSQLVNLGLITSMFLFRLFRTHLGDRAKTSPADGIDGSITVLAVGKAKSPGRRFAI